MHKYRKFIVAAIGTALIIYTQWAGIPLDEANQELNSIVTTIVGVLTALGVYQLPNTPSADDTGDDEHA